MSPLDSLAKLLAPQSAGAAGTLGEVTAGTHGLDDAIARLSHRAAAGNCNSERVDLQEGAVRRFWDSGQLPSLRDARLASFGIGLAAGPGGARILDDRTRLRALLAALDAWVGSPTAYRRCYQGLLRSYFEHDRPSVTDGGAASVAAASWTMLREYLKARAPATRAATHNPDWVVSLARHPCVFGESPGSRLVERLLSGDRSELDALCAQWGISAASWFPQALVRAQVKATTERSHERFIQALPTVLALLRDDVGWRDEGLALLLERHAAIPEAPGHAGLRDAVGVAWGCPWHVTSSTQWERVSDGARSLAAMWLKVDLIERFCSRVTDGSGARRASFWTRFTSSIQHLEFASARAAPLAGDGVAGQGEATRPSASTAPIRDGSGADEAMILTIGGVQLVTLADAGEPVYGYDVRRAQRFDTMRPLAIAFGAQNSLRHADADLQLHHRDGLGEWREWEQSFIAALKDNFALRLVSNRPVPRDGFVDLSDDRPALDPLARDPSVPATWWMSASAGEDVHWHTAEAASVPYSRTSLEVLARVHRLTLRSDPLRPGSVTVEGDSLDHRIERILQRWGFAEARQRCWTRPAERLAEAA